MEKTAITCDVECYKNYFLVTLYRVSDGATVYFDMHNNNLKPHTLENLRSMLQRYVTALYCHHIQRQLLRLAVNLYAYLRL